MTRTLRVRCCARVKPPPRPHPVHDAHDHPPEATLDNRHQPDRLCRHLKTSGLRAAAIHGDKSQNARTQSLRDFKSGRTRVLVATDIAARGLDIEQLPVVINFDLPMVAEDYIHRIGRTGRAGAEGDAFILVSPDEEGSLSRIERQVGQRLPRVTLPDFDYTLHAPKVVGPAIIDRPIADS